MKHLRKFSVATAFAITVSALLALTGFAAPYAEASVRLLSQQKLSSRLMSNGFKPYVPPTTSYANAGGTGNRTNIINATITGTAFGIGTATNLIDGAQANSTYFALGSTGNQFEFQFTRAKYIDEIKIYNNVTNANMGNFQMAGSNDGVTWTNIGSPFTWRAPTTGQTYPMVHDSPNAYIYYRFTQTSGTASNADYLWEIEFKIG